MEMSTRNWELKNKEGDEERALFWKSNSSSPSGIVRQLHGQCIFVIPGAVGVPNIDGQPEDAESVYQSAGSLVSKCHQPTDNNAQQPEGSCIAVISRALWMSTSDPSWRYFALMLEVSNSRACRPLASAVTAVRLGVYGLTYGEISVMPRCQSSHYRLPRCNSGTPAALSMGG